MNKRYLKFFAGLGLAQVMVLGANAQDKPTKQLDEVVVTATKFEKKQSQTGKVVTVITPEQIERSAGKTLPQLLSEQASIIVNGAGSNPGKDKSIFFRGAGSAYAVILLDGVIVSDPSGSGATFDIRMFPLDQVERIEILKGGQSTLYGSDAVAGVINIITKKGGEKGNNISGTVTAGSYNTYKGSLGLNSAVKNFSYNINYTHMRTDGISEATQPDNSPVTFDKDGSKQDAVNANFSLALTDRFKVSPFLRYSTGKYDYDNDAFEDGDKTMFAKHFNTGLIAGYQLDRGKFNLNYSFENTNRDYKTPGSMAVSAFTGKMHMVDFYFNHDLGKNLQILVGVDNRRSDIVLDYVDKGLYTNLFSGYGSLFINQLGGVFNMELGGRYNKHSKYGENYTYTINPSVNVLDNHLKVFGTVATAFRVPTMSMLFGKWGANLELKPEKSTSYEAGLSTSLFDDAFSLRVVGFKRKMTDAIVYTTRYVNQDKQDDKGLEIEPSFKKGIFTINGFYSYVEGKTTSFSTGSAVVTEGLDRRPKHSFGAFVGVQATKGLYLSANYRSYSLRTDKDYRPYPFADVVLPAYALLDAYAQYGFINNRLKVFVDVKNILDKKYEEVYGYNTMGRNFNAGLSFNIR